MLDPKKKKKMLYHMGYGEIIRSTKRTAEVVCFPYQWNDITYTNVWVNFLISIKNKKLLCDVHLHKWQHSIG